MINLGGMVMFKELTKLEKAGLIIGSIECIVGLGMTMYARRQLLKHIENEQFYEAQLDKNK